MRPNAYTRTHFKALIVFVLLLFLLLHLHKPAVTFSRTTAAEFVQTAAGVHMFFLVIKGADFHGQLETVKKCVSSSFQSFRIIWRFFSYSLSFFSGIGPAPGINTSEPLSHILRKYSTRF